MQESSTSTTMLLIFLVVILFFIVIDIFFSSGNKSYSTTKQQESLNDDYKQKREQDKIERRLRTAYWQCLGGVYDEKPNETLIKAKSILNLMQSYHTSGVFTDNNFHDVDLWYEQLAILRTLLDNPRWSDDTSTSYRMPLFLDLDIQYIDELLDERDARPRRTYYRND